MTSTSIVHRTAVASAAVFFAFVFSVSFAYAATNLLSNPGFEATPNASVGWESAGYDLDGNFAAFASSSIIAGPTGNAANITLSGTLNGDAKWIHEAVAISEQGALYTFSDSYTSTVPTSLVAALSGGDAEHPTDVFMQLGTLPATGAGVWKDVSVNFTPFLGYSNVTVYHTISAAGSLTTDNHSLSAVASSSQNLFSQGIVSLTFDDGWTSQYLNAFPLMDGLKATFYMVGKALRGASIHDLFEDSSAWPEPRIVVRNPNDVTWMTLYIDPTVLTYEFTENYSASTTSTIEFSYLVNGATTTQTFGPFDAGDNMVAQFAVVFPSTGAGFANDGVTIVHKSAGALAVAGTPSLASDLTGYMTPAMMQELQTAGNEIGGHTESHCNLVRLDSGEPSTSIDTCAFPEAGLTWQNEITTGRNSVIGFGGNNVVNFAYPNGANNQAIRDYIKNSTGFVSARTVDEGYNTQQTDKMALKVQVVNTDITIEKIKQWIDTAIANQTWLILVFHQVDNPAAPTSNGEDGGTTTTVFTQIVQYLKSKPSGTVKTVAEALAMMTANPLPPTDTTAPVIAAHADVYATATSTNTSTVVTYTNPTATDNVDSSVAVTCAPASGGIFNLGTTTVTCSAQDVAGNQAVQTTFAVGVSAEPVIVVPDTTAPVIVAHADVFAATTSASGELVSYTLPTATDDVDASVAVSCTPTSGSLFAIGSTTVTCVAHDAALNYATTTFAVGVTQTAVTPVDPSCSGNQHLDNHVCVDNPVTPSSNGGGSGSGGGGGGIVGTGPYSIGYVNNNPTGGAVLGASTGSSLTEQQIQSILGLLRSFNADQSVIASVEASLRGTVSAPSVTFTETLTVGSRGAQVNALQQILINLGFLKIAAPTGYFGSLTKSSVMLYQTSRGIEAVGIVGPKTRAALNSNAPALAQ